VKVKHYARKPPVLEGDINFIELHFPELRFVRIESKHDELGIPCMATSSSLGDIYFCPHVAKDERTGIVKMDSAVFICNKFKLDGVEDEVCSRPCLVPEGGRYLPPAFFEVKPEAEATGECARIKVTPREGLFTDYGSAVVSQFVAVKEFLTGDPGFNMSVGENVFRAVLENVDSFVKKHGVCRSKKNLERDEEFLRSVGENVLSSLSRDVLEVILPRQFSESGEPLFSCRYLHEHGVVHHPSITKGHATPYATEIIEYAVKWSDAYETHEFAEEYFAQFTYRERVMRELSKLSLRDIKEFLEELSAEKALRGKEASIASDMYNKIYDFVGDEELDAYSSIKDILYWFDCWDLVDVIEFDAELCSEMDRYRELLEEMKKHEAMPGLEEEKERKMREYKAALASLREDLDDIIREYAEEVAESYVQELMATPLERLESAAKERGRDWRSEIASDMADDFAKFITDLCSTPAYFHYCEEALAHASAKKYMR